jgi:serine/threonine protein kinase
MPVPTNADEFIALVRKSNLIDPARLEAYLATHPGPHESPAALAQRMRADGLLGGFHVEQLLRGRYRGFFLGKHKVLDRIGLGGMGQVFLAEHVNMRRRVAIKVLPPDRASNEFTRQRFLREARAAGQLDHPNLVRAYDVDEDRGVYFLVMEYVDGVSLYELITRVGPLAPERAAHYLWQAANGLQYMSERGMVHRDIKPANLLVDRLGVIKILDLGLVRSQEETDSLTRGEGVKILGTADYLAPEQAIDCSRVDVRADIYGLGATGYFLLTGRPPFGGEKVAQKLIAHQTQPVIPVHELRPEVPPELSAVISRMLAKRPSDRYQTPAEVISALDPWAAEPPPPPTGREIPAVAGCEMYASSAAVNLSWSAVKAASRSGSRPGIATGPGSGSGSGIRFQSDSNVGIGQKSSPRPDQTPLPTALAPGTGQPVEPKFWGGQTLPPVLPASATHALAGDAARGVRGRPAAVAGPATPVHTRPSSLRQVLVAVTIVLTVTLAVWTVSLLTGLIGSSSQVPEQLDAPAVTEPARTP